MKTVAVTGMYNEQGLQVLELKKVLLQNKNNPLIVNGLLSSLKKSAYDQSVYVALTSMEVDEKSFEATLLTFDKYTNVGVLKEKFSDFQKKLSNALERNNVDYFTTDSSPKDGGVLVVRKCGIGINNIRQEFRLTEGEAVDQFTAGFVEKFAHLKLTAMFKTLIPEIQKTLKIQEGLKLSISDMYFVSERMLYNVDFVITVVMTEKQLAASSIDITNLAKKLKEILAMVEKEYYRVVKG